MTATAGIEASMPTSEPVNPLMAPPIALTRNHEGDKGERRMDVHGVSP